MHPRRKKANERWQELAASFGYASEREMYLAEFKDKNTKRLADKLGVSARTLRYRIEKCGISLYDEEGIAICGACGIRSCTWPNKNVCDYCMQTDIEPGYEHFG